MHFILPYFIIFLVIIQILIKKSSKNYEERNSKFWEKESKANSTRKADIGNLPYITIPDNLPLSAVGNQKIESSQKAILSLKDTKILNLTGISNTDLKLKYGPANLEFLSECDERFTTLCTELTKLASELINTENEDDAVSILEYAINIGSDVTSDYTMLAEIYKKSGRMLKISELSARAGTLKSLSSKTIQAKLNNIMKLK